MNIEPVHKSIESLLSSVDYRLAESRQDRETIYRLRYRAYLREGAVQPSERGMVTDNYEDDANAWIFGVFIENELCSSIRISVLNKKMRRSPSAELFPDILDPLLDAGQVMVDPCRFVADYEKSRKYPKLPQVTTRLALLACEHFRVNLGLAIVRKEHEPFYSRLFMHQPIAEPRLFPGLIKPVGLMGVHYQEHRNKVLQRCPYLRSSAFERRMLFKDSMARMQ